jgi:hypothetical protein
VNFMVPFPTSITAPMSFSKDLLSVICPFPCRNPLSPRQRRQKRACWCVAVTTSWEPQEEGMMSTIVSFSLVRNQGLIDQ